MKAEAENYSVVFGSNLISNCGKVIELAGRGFKKQIIRFRESDDGKIMLTCTVKNQEGNTVAKVANNIVQHTMEDYEAQIDENGIRVINKSSGEIWLEFIAVQPRQFKLNGIFHIPGQKIIATDSFLQINSNRISECVFDSCSSAIGLG